MNTPQLKNTGPDSSDSGSRVISFHLIAQLLSTLLCPICKHDSLQLHEKPINVGTALSFYAKLQVKCMKCERYVAETKTCENVPSQSRLSTTNVRAVASGRNCGIGYQQMWKFFSGMNIPKPMHSRTYQRIAKKVGYRQ